MSSTRQETVTLATLDLLQKTTDYLKRLPIVPVTRELIREIDAHLADPRIVAARIEAEQVKLLESKRVSRWLTPGGQVRFDVLVEGAKFTIRVPVLRLAPGKEDTRMAEMGEGLTMLLEPLREA